jgi:hypothetical protein
MLDWSASRNLEQEGVFHMFERWGQCLLILGCAWLPGTDDLIVRTSGASDIRGVRTHSVALLHRVIVVLILAASPSHADAPAPKLIFSCGLVRTYVRAAGRSLMVT